MATLEELEGEVWPDPDDPTPLVKRCLRLRKKNLDEFTTGDLRQLLSQGIGLAHLASLALTVLEREPLEDAGFYPGALLCSLIVPQNRAGLEGWSQRMEAVCRAALEHLPSNPPDVAINEEMYPAVERETAEKILEYLERRSSKH